MLESGWVTVVIPTYNRAQLIGETVQSVFAQTYDRWDIVVVDDGSIDDTAEVVAQFSDRVTYLQRQHSGLPALARNTGIDHARGEFIAFLDSDDLWLPTKLAVQVAAMESNPQAGLVCTNATRFGESRCATESLFWPDCSPPSGKVFAQLYQGNFIVTSTALMRRECLEKAGKFNESWDVRFCEDYELWLRLALQYDVICVPEVLAKCRVHQLRPERNFGEDLMRVANVLIETRARYPTFVSQVGTLADRRIAGVYRELGMYSFKHNCFHEAHTYFDEALHWCPNSLGLRAMRLLSGLGFLPVAQLLSARDRLLRMQARGRPRLNL